MASILSKYRETMAWQTDFQQGDLAVNVRPRKRLWWPYPNVIRDSFVLTAACFGGLCVIDRCFVGGGFGEWITGENDVLETMQLLILAATVIVAILALTQATGNSGSHPRLSGQ